MKINALALRCAILFIAAVAAGCAGDAPDTATSAIPAPLEVKLEVLSSKADMVSNNSALLRVEVPGLTTSILSGSSTVSLTVNGVDAIASFKQENATSVMGLVTGLAVGDNVVKVAGARLKTTELKLKNYPVAGPIFSGPHESPFNCQTANFRLPASSTTLGAALDTDCSVATRVDYVYRNLAGAFVPLPSGSRPIDISTTTTISGKTASYIVRVETGTVNRAVYQTAVLSDPAVETAPTPLKPPAAWNGRVVYSFGGGCTGGWYIQGASVGYAGILEDTMLRRGYAVASASLNVFGSNCNHVLAAETAFMVKEQFIKTYGPIAATIGYGCSGGSEQQNPIADAYPGLLDGIITGCSFPDVSAGMIINLTDADLWRRYTQNTTLTWAVSEQIAVTGYPNTQTAATLQGFANRVKAVGGQCNALVPVATRYDPVTNPTGVRCDIYDHNINIFGKDPLTGFARRPLDNVGVQYGLKALNDGKITKAQFIDLNRAIGGYDNDGVYSATRTSGDPIALEIAYRTGQVTDGGLGLRSTPIIDHRGYVDLPADVHEFFHSFSMRDRLLKINGSLENHVMLVDNPYFGEKFDPASPVLFNAIYQMDQWITNLLKVAPRGSATLAQIGTARPADLTDACFKADGTKIAETQVYQGTSECNTLYKAFSTPRMEAGGPLANNILKCSLKPITAADYKVTFTMPELLQLQAIFPQGVCDWTKAGIGQVRGTLWPKF